MRRTTRDTISQSLDGVKATAREQEVASLVAEGCANRDIAARLYIAEATVKDHVHNILRTTGLTSRAALAGLWARYEASPFDQTTSVR